MARLTLISLLIAGLGLTPPAGACETAPAAVACMPAPDRPEDRGRADANRDVDAGEPTILEFGLRPPRAGLVAQLLERHLGLRHVSQGCVITPETEAYANAYNEQVRLRLEQEHGPGVIEAVGEEARLLTLIEGLEDRSHRAMRHAGAVTAGDDVEAGRLLKLRFGRLAGIDRVLAELLHEALGVVTVVVHERPEGMTAFADGYNDRMRGELRARAGLERWREIVRKAAVVAAERDIAEGRLVVTIWGFPGPADHVYQELLEDRFGIEVRMGGCVLPEDYDPQHYDRRMLAEIERRFGEGVLEKTYEEARGLAGQG